MPSPIGHALGGIAAGALVSANTRGRWLVLFAVAGVASDLDLLLPLQHRGASHSVGVALLIVAGASLWRRLERRQNHEEGWQLPLGLGAAFGSHVLLDWLGTDSATPRGVMALWPLSQAYYISGFDVFDRIERRYWMPGMLQGTAMALLREVSILGPVTWLTLRTRRRPGQTTTTRR